MNCIRNTTSWLIPVFSIMNYSSVRSLFIVFFSLIQLLTAQQLVDKVVAVVEGEAILQSDVLQSAQLQAMQDQVNLGSNQYLLDKYMKDALDALVNQYVVYKVAEEDTLISLTDDELDSALEQQIQAMVDRAGSKEKLEEALGKSIKKIKKDYKDELNKMMLIDKYRQKFYQDQDITRTEVVDFYNTYRDSIPTIPPQSKFSLIEIPIEPGLTSQHQAEAFLNQLLDSLKMGADFADLAKKYSDDTGTAPYGGDLGFIDRGTLVKEYEEAAFSLKIGQISQPIKTDYGYHIIQLMDKQGEKIRTRHILKQVLPTSADRENALVTVRKIFSEIEQQPSIFDSLATIYMKKYNNLSGVYGWRNDSELGEEISDLLKEATEEGYTYPKESSNNSFLLGFLYDHKASKTPTLENSWDDIEQLALQYKINDQFQKWINKTKEDAYIRFY